VSPFFVLARLRVLDVLRSGTSGVLFLVFPLVLLGVVGIVFMNGHPFERRHVVLVGEGPALDAVAAELARFPEVRVEHASSEAGAIGRLKSRMASAVIVPAEGRELRLVVGPKDELFGRGVLHEVPSLTRLEIQAVPRWGYVHYLFPGLLTFSVMLAGLFGMGYAMARYRQNLFLKKLATTPLPKSTFILAQIAARGLLVLAQIAVLVIAARLVFGLPLTLASVAWLFVFTLLGLLTFMAIGFSLAVVVKTESVMIDVINAVTVPLVLFSEIFFPADELPGPLPQLAAALPSTQMVRLTRDVLLYGVTDASALLPGMLVLVAWSLVNYVVSLALFKWHS
jgi:ABC-type multidrug transport system permease subunit